MKYTGVPGYVIGRCVVCRRYWLTAEAHPRPKKSPENLNLMGKCIHLTSSADDVSGIWTIVGSIPLGSILCANLWILYGITMDLD
jgi:hypothetical protein